MKTKTQGLLMLGMDMLKGHSFSVVVANCMPFVRNNTMYTSSTLGLKHIHTAHEQRKKEDGHWPSPYGHSNEVMLA
jgi:hypothetical protein